MKLPIPDKTALAHSEKITHFIRQQIADKGGFISFAQFMEYALYAPGLGYYSAGSHKLGKGGDFITAPEMSPLFAQCIAKQCEQILAELKTGDILEIGAGSGIFAKDLLLALEKSQQLPEHYFILEVSAELRERQMQFLKSACPQLFSRIQWLDTLPVQLNGIIFANEVMDAMPVNCFEMDASGIKERCVAWKNNAFAWHLAQPTTPEVTEQLDILQQEFDFDIGYQSELNSRLPAWISSLADCLQKGMILLFDYGYGRNEYYHPDRRQGTLMCFYQHHHHDNPFILMGLQDITAHVDFTAVIESAMDMGLKFGGYTTQTSFLLACGLLELANQNQLSDIEYYEQNQAIKKLTLPSQMGELIKVMGLTKEIDLSLIGFELHDRRRDL
jgi:SAM-dependent MidA family methyltransferase